MTATMKTQTKMFRGLLSAAFLLALSLAAIAFYLLTPSRCIALDVNPSLELHLNRLDQVVRVVGANEDAKALLAAHAPTEKKLDAVIDELLDAMVTEGYLTREKANDVLISGIADNGKTLEKVSAQVLASLDRHALPAEILTQSLVPDKAMEQSAKENHVSVGKMTLIDRLMQQDAALTAEDLASTRISDLVDYAAAQNVPLDLLEERLDDLKDRGDSPQLEVLENALDELDDKASDAEDAADKAEVDDADDAAEVDDADDAADVDDVEDTDDADDADEKPAAKPVAKPVAPKPGMARSEIAAAGKSDDTDDADDAADVDDADDADDVEDTDDADDTDDVEDTDDADDTDDTDEKPAVKPIAKPVAPKPGMARSEIAAAGKSDDTDDTADKAEIDDADDAADVEDAD